MNIEFVQIVGFIFFIVGVLLVLADQLLKILQAPKNTFTTMADNNFWDFVLKFLEMIKSVMKKFGGLGQVGIVLIIFGFILLIIPYIPPILQKLNVLKPEATQAAPTETAVP